MTRASAPPVHLLAGRPTGSLRKAAWLAASRRRRQRLRGWCAHDVQMRRLRQSVELSRSDYGRELELVSIAAPYVCTRYECHRLILIRLSLTYPRFGGGNIAVVGISSLPQGQAQPMDGLPGDVEADRLEAWSCFHAGNIRAVIIMGRAANAGTPPGQAHSSTRCGKVRRLPSSWCRRRAFTSKQFGGLCPDSDSELCRGR